MSWLDGVLYPTIEKGFDLSHVNETGESVTVRCSQCEALVINGTPTHETGCLNETHECQECDAWIPLRRRLCEDCANPEYEPHDILCVNCGEQLDQCLDDDCAENDHHSFNSDMCEECQREDSDEE